MQKVLIVGLTMLVTLAHAQEFSGLIEKTNSKIELQKLHDYAAIVYGMGINLVISEKKNHEVSIEKGKINGLLQENGCMVYKMK